MWTDTPQFLLQLSPFAWLSLNKTHIIYRFRTLCLLDTFSVEPSCHAYGLRLYAYTKTYKFFRSFREMNLRKYEKNTGLDVVNSVDLFQLHLVLDLRHPSAPQLMGHLFRLSEAHRSIEPGCRRQRADRPEKHR